MRFWDFYGAAFGLMFVWYLAAAARAKKSVGAELWELLFGCGVCAFPLAAAVFYPARIIVRTYRAARGL